MLALQIISATALVSIAFISWRGYVRESRRLRKLQEKAELGDKIQRKLDVLIRDNTRVLSDFFQTGEFDERAANILEEENIEVEEMIQKFERM